MIVDKKEYNLNNKILMKKLVIHLISESSGQTVKHAANTAISNFRDVEIKRYHWPMTRNNKIMKEVLEKVKAKPGIIIYTISNDDLRNNLKKFSLENKIPCISVVSKIIRGISEYIGVGTGSFLGYPEKFDDSYFDRMDAIDFTLRHDDGQHNEDIEESDIVLIGPSRTSKTPTSVYLAYNGFKVTNIPYIQDIPLDDRVVKLKSPVVFGLIINPARLIEIRQTRMNLLQINESSNYTDISVVQDECKGVRRLCSENNWNFIDVSRRSIEETAALIMKNYYEIRKKRIYVNTQ